MKRASSSGISRWEPRVESERAEATRTGWVLLERDLEVVRVCGLNVNESDDGLEFGSEIVTLLDDDGESGLGMVAAGEGRGDGVRNGLESMIDEQEICIWQEEL